MDKFSSTMTVGGKTLLCNTSAGGLDLSPMFRTCQPIYQVLFCNLIGPPGLLMHAITCLVLGKALPHRSSVCLVRPLVRPTCALITETPLFFPTDPLQRSSSEPPTQGLPQEEPLKNSDA